MLDSARITAALIILVTLASCATTRPKPPPTGTPTATLIITPGIPVLAQAAMPPGFEPIPFRPPLWLEGGNEIAVSGVQAGRSGVRNDGAGSGGDLRSFYNRAGDRNLRALHARA
ncbi:MAG: hypothetical protein WA005_05625 [Candidatus Binataceae bacterium]